jgi:hypothetical protein
MAHRKTRKAKIRHKKLKLNQNKKESLSHELRRLRWEIKILGFLKVLLIAHYVWQYFKPIAIW